MTRDRIPLDSPTACLQELERASMGLSQLTQEATRNREALGLIEEQIEMVEAIVSAEVRKSDEKGLTAGEVKGRVTLAIAEHPELSRIRESAFELRAEADNLARRLRTLEKRAMSAQSAMKAHESEARNAGYGGKA